MAQNKVQYQRGFRPTSSPSYNLDGEPFLMRLACPSTLTRAWRSRTVVVRPCRFSRN